MAFVLISTANTNDAPSGVCLSCLLHLILFRKMLRENRKDFYSRPGNSQFHLCWSCIRTQTESETLLLFENDGILYLFILRFFHFPDLGDVY